MIALGTIWGGWRIIETMGLRITRLNANSGVAANIGATTAIFGATELGIPISTTQAAAASVMGSGAASGSGLNRRKISEMVVAWDLHPAGCGGRRVPHDQGDAAAQSMGLGAPSGAQVPALLTWAGRLMLHAEDADDVAAMLPTDAELHEFHAAPHPDVHAYRGPEHVNHHELEPRHLWPHRATETLSSAAPTPSLTTQPHVDEPHVDEPLIAPAASPAPIETPPQAAAPSTAPAQSTPPAPR